MIIPPTLLFAFMIVLATKNLLGFHMKRNDWFLNSKSRTRGFSLYPVTFPLEKDLRSGNVTGNRV